MQKTAAFSRVLEQVEGVRIFVGPSSRNRQHQQDGERQYQTFEHDMFSKD
jgi:hypothetical protein